MAEMILGTGVHKSLHRLLSIVDGQVRKREGIPCKLSISTPTVRVIAERPSFESDFSAYALRVQLTGSARETFRNAAREWSACSSLVEEGDWQTFACPTDGKGDSAQVNDAIEKMWACLTPPEVWHVQGDKFRVDHVSVALLFQAMVQYKASDVHLSPGLPPIFRIDNQVKTSDLMGPLSAVQLMALTREITSEKEWREFTENKQTSFSFHQVGIGYARVSAFLKFGVPHVTFRFLPEIIPSFEELNVPPETMVKLAELHRGLLLVTGMTGSGKTTTCAALLDWINTHRSLHILCIENPVEYVHINKKSVISQRTLGVDVNSFDEAVTGALRHDPDVIMIGEMRDPDTIRSAINAASTGHLVISTLHANTASEVVNRIVSFFDPVERDLVKLQLRDCVQCVICQRLVPKIGGGRVPALEILFNDIKPISDAIIAGDTDNIRIGMQQTVSHSFLFENYLNQLERAGKIDVQTAQDYSTDRTMYDQLHMGTYSVPRLEALKAARDASQRG